MGGGGSNTTTTKADPWKPAQPDLQGLLPMGREMFDSGRFSTTPWAGPTVAGASDATRQANGMIMGMPRDLTAGGMASMSGLAQGQTPYARLMGSTPALASLGRGNEMLSQLQGGNRTLAAMGRGDPRLAGMTSGDQIYRDLDGVKKEALGSAIPAAVSQFAGNGMTDSSAAMDTVGRAATQAVAPIDYQAWQTAQDRSLAAVGQDNATRMAAIGQNDATRMGAQSQEAQQRMQALGQDFQQQLGAYGLRQGGQLGAAGLLPELQRSGYLPAMMMGQVGAQNDQRSQARLDGQIQNYYDTQNQDLNNLLGYTNFVQGIAGQGSTQSQTAPGGASGASRVLGAGLGGLGAYGALAMNPVTAPFALAGGIGAGLMGIL